MKAISNSSVLIALSTIGQLNLLKRRFPDGIIVPNAVWHEVVETGQDYPGAKEVASSTWIKVTEVNDLNLVSLLCRELDVGEAEAIVLYHENSEAVLLLDEKDARKVARRMGFPILGTVGLLVWAKKSGLISSLKDQLDVLQTKGEFRLSRFVYEKALSAVGEAE